MPTVSVVIPTYNAPHLLLQTLESVFAQTFEDYEIVVINDGSTDDTLARLESLQARHGGKLRIITQPNGGIGVARNRGLDEARGEYIALLDHDDLWMPDKLETQVAFMRSHLQCAGCGTVFALSTSPEKPYFRAEEVSDESGIVARPLWHSAHGRGVFQTSTLMVDGAKIGGVRYATERHCIEDVSFHIKLMGRGEFGIAGAEILAIYRVFENNASKNPLFYYGGIKQLRRMQKEGEFEELDAERRRDAEIWMGHIGRFAAILQFNIGRRRYGAELYIREFVHQLRLGRWKFLATYPFMLVMPNRWIQAAYARKFAAIKREAGTLARDSGDSG